MNQQFEIDMKLKILAFIKYKINAMLHYFDLEMYRIPKKNIEASKFFENIIPLSTNNKLIRVGNNNDGGYLIPDDLEGIKTCFSPGVSNMSDFELDLTTRNIKCFLADYSVESVPIQNDLITFEKKFLGNKNDHMFMTLTSWVNNNAKQGDNDLILQMDIEGAEYDVLIETPYEILKRFRILVIEFHDIDALLNPMGFKLIDGVFSKLLNFFEIVHIHPNNCCKPVNYKKFAIPPVMEFTFLRKDRISDFTPTKTFPHELDSPNSLHNNNFSLPSCWYNKI